MSDFEGLRARLCGVVAVTVTPFDRAGAVDEQAYAAVVRRMVDAGIPAVTANGNTGEFYALSQAEADRAVALCVEAAGGRADVVAGVGYDLDRAVAGAVAATRTGAGAVMVHQPVHPYQSAQGWLDYHRAVAEAVPEHGVVVYLRSPRVGADTLAALAAACPNLVAVKYAVPDVFALSAAIEAVGPQRVAWVCGLAEAWAPFHWLAGARGFTSGLATIAPGLSLQLADLLGAGTYDEAMRLWRSLVGFERLRARADSADNVSAVKEGLAQLGLCARAVRPPMTELGDSDRAEVTRILDSWGPLP